MIQKILNTFNTKTQNINFKKHNKITNPIQNNYQNQNNNNSQLFGIPRGYINFKANENKVEEKQGPNENNNEPNYKLNPDTAKTLYVANSLKEQFNHSEINAYDLLASAIIECTDFFNHTNTQEQLPALISIINNYSGIDILEKDSTLDLFLKEFDKLEDNILKKIEISSDENLSIKQILEDISAQKKDEEITNTDLIVGALNSLTYAGEDFPTKFLKKFKFINLVKSKEEIQDNHIKSYDARAIDIWNKLAIGSNLFITYNDKKEEDYLTTSIIKTINAPKHGNINNKNTEIYALTPDITGKDLLALIEEKMQNSQNKKHIFLGNLSNLLINSKEENEETYTFTQEIIQAIKLANNENIKLIFFQDKDSYYANFQNASIKNLFEDFIEYSTPPMHTFEAIEVLNKQKKLLKDVPLPFTKDAKEKAILLADGINGAYPKKAVDYMKRIANYYKNEKTKITLKEVDEFALIAKELFNKTKDNYDVIYDTGKNLSSLIGKETTKKDAEAIVRQIRSGKLGTKGLIIYSEDEMAGSGRRYTAQAIAGEARIPFIEIDSSEFAREIEDSDGDSMSPKQAIKKVFTNARNAAEQNPNKTTMIFINHFEELAFSGPYLAGYKEAMAQLEKEMTLAEKNNLNLLIVGSTEENYAPIIPLVAKNFNQNLTINSPATNKQARQEIIENYIQNKQIPLVYKNVNEKENLIKKLVKITEGMSFVEIKSMLDKAEQIMFERNKTKADIGEFIESYLQLCAGRTSHPEMPEYNKEATTSHECGHATNLEVMSNILKSKGKPWHQSRNVNFITLDPRGNFLGAVFEGRSENSDYPFEALFTDLVCCYGGYSCEKRFFDMDGSTGITQDLAQASSAAKRGVEYFGMGHNTGKISNAAKIQSGNYNENVFKDMNVILKNAQYVSDLITEVYSDFNKQFTDKYAKLIGSNDCMVDGDDFRALLANWTKSQSKNMKEEIAILEDMVMDVIKATKNGIIYGKSKEVEDVSKNVIQLVIPHDKNFTKQLGEILTKTKI